MPYEFKDGKVITRSIEYSVSYHCNLTCFNCSHLAPFAAKKFPPVEGFASDIERLGKVLHANVIRLLGGEPLLNPEINLFIKIAKASGIADHVMVTTNGTRLHKMDDDFWENIDYILVTWYPNVQLKENIVKLKRKAAAFDTLLWFSIQSAFRTMIVTEPHPRDWITKIIFKTCKDVHLHHCHMLYEGNLFKCAVSPFLPGYLRTIGDTGYDPKKDAFNLYESDDNYFGLKTFLETSSMPDSCRFCLGCLGKVQPHRQLTPVVISDPSLNPVTRKRHLDRRIFIKEWLRYWKNKIIKINQYDKREILI